jgi:Fic family protein
MFVPPPAHELNRVLSEFEKFLYEESQTLALTHIALMHAQFETIHPFLDGNGRTGRLLVPLLLCRRGILEKPALFLSSYFKKHQSVYYQKLNDYRENKVEQWVDFFLDGVIQTAKDSVSICKDITIIRNTDMEKIQSLGKRESASGVKLLRQLFATPIVSASTVMEWTGFSRMGAQKVIDRFIKLEILVPKDTKAKYDRTYSYKRYIKVFLK